MNEKLKELERKFEERLTRPVVVKPRLVPPPKPKLDTAVLEWPKRIDPIRYQQMLDAAWERTLEARQELEAQAARCCHRGPGDPDWVA